MRRFLLPGDSLNYLGSAAEALVKKKRFFGRCPGTSHLVIGPTMTFVAVEAVYAYPDYMFCQIAHSTS